MEALRQMYFAKAVEASNQLFQETGVLAAADALAAATLFARDLMRGDAATFKAGYTAENAALAAADVFGVEGEDVLRALHALAGAAADAMVG